METQSEKIEVENEKFPESDKKVVEEKKLDAQSEPVKPQLETVDVFSVKTENGAHIKQLRQVPKESLLDRLAVHLEHEKNATLMQFEKSRKESPVPRKPPTLFELTLGKISIRNDKDPRARICLGNGIHTYVIVYEEKDKAVARFYSFIDSTFHDVACELMKTFPEGVALSPDSFIHPRPF